MQLGKREPVFANTIKFAVSGENHEANLLCMGVQKALEAFDHDFVVRSLVEVFLFLAVFLLFFGPCPNGLV
jgi:hypothetical protein